MTHKQLVEALVVAVLGAFIYEELIKGTSKTFKKGSTGTPNAIAIPTTPPMASVSSGSSVLSSTQTGNSLYESSGLGNNPIPQPTTPAPVIPPYFYSRPTLIHPVLGKA
jgi:hypothetical protein